MARLLLAVSAVAMLAVSLGSAQAPPQVPPQQPAIGTGFISGRVVDAVSGKPIPEATVLLNGRSAALQAAGLAGGGRGAAPPPPPPPPAVLTDSQGRFFFASLVPGMYSAQVQKVGFVGAPIVPLQLAEGERVLDWRLRLAKLSSLGGTLRDETGDPAVGVDVSLFRRSLVNGRQSWQYSSRSRSDDRGAFRFGSVTAGDFVVCACGRDPIPFDPLLLSTLGAEPLQLMAVAARALSQGADAVSLDSTLRTWAPMFYPNTSSLARATKIALASGEDKTGIDMNLSIVHATRVSGTIIGATGPVAAGSIRLIPEADADAGMSLLALTPMLAQPDGRFDFAPVPPGQYRLVVVHRPGLATGGPSGTATTFAGARGMTPPSTGATMSAAGPAATEPPQWASEPITVGENGISGLVVHLNRSLAVSGRVDFVGAGPQPPATVYNRFNFPLLPVSLSDPMAQQSTASARFSPDGTFLVPGAVPGKYTLGVRGLPPFQTLKSIMMGGVDLTDLPLVVGERDLADIVITFVDTPLASLTITIIAAPGSQGDDGLILVFPSDRKYWAESSAALRRFRTIAMSAKTTVTTPDLPAGDYLVVAVTALEATDWMEAGKLELLSKRAQRVTIPDTGKAAVEVRR